MKRESGHAASAAPSEPTATGTPTHGVPVMAAAMMPPTAMPIEVRATADLRCKERGQQPGHAAAPLPRRWGRIKRYGLIGWL
jgi:hypothetical protein